MLSPDGAATTDAANDAAAAATEATKARRETGREGVPEAEAALPAEAESVLREEIAEEWGTREISARQGRGREECRTKAMTISLEREEVAEVRG